MTSDNQPDARESVAALEFLSKLHGYRTLPAEKIGGFPELPMKRERLWPDCADSVEDDVDLFVNRKPPDAGRVPTVLCALDSCGALAVRDKFSRRRDRDFDPEPELTWRPLPCVSRSGK